MSRIRAHLIFSTIHIKCVQQPYTLFRYIFNTYSMHKCTLVLYIITHLHNFSDDEMYANWPRTVAPCHGSRIHPRGGAVVRGQLAYISSSEKCCKCLIMYNIRVNLRTLYVLILYLNKTRTVLVHIIIWIVKKPGWARILDKCRKLSEVARVYS